MNKQAIRYVVTNSTGIDLYVYKTEEEAQKRADKMNSNPRRECHSVVKQRDYTKLIKWDNEHKWGYWGN
jgi:hypothetical protein